MTVLLVSEQQIKNVYNILFLQDTTVNVGPFWYINVNMFTDHLFFFRVFWLVMQAVMACFVTMHIHKTF